MSFVSSVWKRITRFRFVWESELLRTRGVFLRSDARRGTSVRFNPVCTETSLRGKDRKK